MRTISCDNVVREWWKCMKWSLKWHSCYWKKCKFPHFLTQWQQKLKSFEIILKVNPTKLENAFENLNHIRYVTWVVTKNPKLQAWVSLLAHKETEQSNVCGWLHFADWAAKVKYVPQLKIEELLKKRKVWKVNRNINPSKSSPVKRCFQEN